MTDGGLAAVPCLTNLHAMSLCNTNVSDAGLVHLKGSSKLQILDLRNTKVTHAGARAPKIAPEAEDIALTPSGIAIVTASARRT